MRRLTLLSAVLLAVPGCDVTGLDKVLGGFIVPALALLQWFISSSG